MAHSLYRRPGQHPYPTPTKKGLLPDLYDVELLHQVIDFAVMMQPTRLNGSVSYFLTDILTRIRCNDTSSPLRVSGKNDAARAMRLQFPADSRLWLYVMLT